VVKNLPGNAGDAGDTGLIPGLGRYPGGGKRQLTPVFLPGNSQGQRNLVGYSPRVRKESAMTECTHMRVYTHTHTLIFPEQT